MFETGDRFIIEHNYQVSAPIPDGVLELDGLDPLRLTSVRSRKAALVIPGPVTIKPTDTARQWLIEASGWRLQLLFVGMAASDNLNWWKDIRTHLVGQPIILTRLPGGTSAWNTVEKMILAKGTILIHLRDSNGVSTALPASPKSLGAIYWDKNANLEIRTPDGVGVSLRPCRCSKCGAMLEAHQWKTLDNKDYCPSCYQEEARENDRRKRSRAQKAVGVCRGCMYYAVVYGGKNFGMDGKRHGACINKKRIAQLGPLRKTASSCIYRQSRGKGEDRPRITITGKLGTESFRGRRPQDRTVVAHAYTEKR